MMIKTISARFGLVQFLLMLGLSFSSSTQAKTAEEVVAELPCDEINYSDDAPAEMEAWNNPKFHGKIGRGIQSKIVCDVTLQGGKEHAVIAASEHFVLANQAVRLRHNIASWPSLTLETIKPDGDPQDRSNRLIFCQLRDGLVICDVMLDLNQRVGLRIYGTGPSNLAAGFRMRVLPDSKLETVISDIDMNKTVMFWSEEGWTRLRPTAPPYWESYFPGQTLQSGPQTTNPLFQKLLTTDKQKAAFVWTSKNGAATDKTDDAQIGINVPRLKLLGQYAIAMANVLFAKK